MKHTKRNKFVFGAGTALSIFVVAIMISSATAVPVLNKASNSPEIENDSNRNSIEVNNEIFVDPNTHLTENDDALDNKKELLFNLLVETLNNEELRKNLKNDFNVKYLKHYTYDDIENLYQEGLEIYESTDMDKIKNKFNNFLIEGNDLYQSVSNFIKENDEISASIEELSTNCEECNSNEYDIDPWSPGFLVCGYLFLILLAFWPAYELGLIIWELTGGVLGWGLMAPWLIIAAIFIGFGCEEILGLVLPPFPY